MVFATDSLLKYGGHRKFRLIRFETNSFLHAMSPNRRRLIRFFEYAAVSASIAGAIATLATQKPAYAVAPLSVSAALNLVGRRQRSQQLDETIQRESQKASDSVGFLQQVDQRIEVLEQQRLSHQTDIETLTKTVDQYNKQIRAKLKSKSAASAQITESIRTRLRTQEQKLTELESDRDRDALAIQTLTQALEQTKVQSNTVLAGLQHTRSALSNQLTNQN